MDGLLVIDKPAGPTSHDVVARVRRALRERRIGHTGTLDPVATGVLPLVVGRATRLARFLSAGDKSYAVVIQLGVRTDTADRDGRPVGERYSGPWPSRDAIDRALDAFRGSFLQQPPAFSAKRIAGKRSYDLARAATAREDIAQPRPAPVIVTARTIELVTVDEGELTINVECSAGFYVRALAHDLGEALETGAHVVALRRTRIDDVGLDQAIGLHVAERDPARVAAALIPLADMLPRLSRVVLTADGVRRAMNGCELGPRDTNPDTSQIPDPASQYVRLFDPAGQLAGIASVKAPGLLHPSVILV
jgi:tRNA pseudouridine55 synthase